MADPYLSEIKYLGGASLDFIEVSVDAGTDVSDIFVTVYNPNGTIRSYNALDPSTYVATVGGKDIYLIDTTTSTTFNGLNARGAVALEQDGILLSFSSFTNGPRVTATEGIADGETSTKIGRAGAGQSLETTDGGTTYVTQPNPSPGSIPCICIGSLVETVDGPIPVEDLKPGALIYTYDGKTEPLALMMRRKVTARDMAKNPNLRPIRISAGSLGDNTPKRDLWVSRQHRMLVNSPIAEKMNGVPSVLVSAIHLTSCPGIEIDPNKTETEYFHLLFKRHTVIRVEGAATESLLLGNTAVNLIDREFKAEIESIFPGFEKEPAKPLLPIPTAAKQKRLVERHAKNQKPLQSL